METRTEHKKFVPVFRAEIEDAFIEIELLDLDPPRTANVQGHVALGTQEQPLFRIRVHFFLLSPRPSRLRQEARAVQGVLTEYFERKLGTRLYSRAEIRDGSIDIFAYVGGFLGSAITAKTLIDFVKDYPKIKEGGQAMFKDAKGLLERLRDRLRRLRSDA